MLSYNKFNDFLKETDQERADQISTPKKKDF